MLIRTLPFQSTLPVGGATSYGYSGSFMRQRFQSTLPVGGATIHNLQRGRCDQFQSTLPVGGATSRAQFPGYLADISIHAPRGGSDGQKPECGFFQLYFNPRSPWGERLPACVCNSVFPYFNPRSPWGERLMIISRVILDIPISIHAPRGGSDTSFTKSFQNRARFQSTLPVGGATQKCHRSSGYHHISIHAPRGGSDVLSAPVRYSRRLFQSTLPVGGATRMRFILMYVSRISIHAPRGGSDSKDAQFYLRIFGEKVNFECYFLVNSRCQPVS